MKKILLPTVILFFLSASFVYALEEEKSPAFGAFMTGVMGEKHIPAIAIARVENGKIEFSDVYGLANIEKETPATKETLFNIASISKPIMGVVLMQMVDKGLLDIDRDINHYLPFKIDNPKLDGEVITLRHLASHSSGIDDHYDVSSFRINEDSELSLGDHLRSLLTPSGLHYDDGAYYLETMPGTARKYSNLGAGLAGFLVECITGKTLANYSKTFFASLGMNNTSWLLHDLDLRKIATPYEWEGGKLVAYPIYGNPQYPDGGVRTTIMDLSNLMVAILNNTDQNGQRLLSDKQREEMFSLQLPPQISTNQRFFWRDNSTGMIGHMGSDIGVFTAFYFDPENKNGFIILMNRGQDAETTEAMILIAKRLQNF